MMIPELKHIDAVQSLYLAFFERLQQSRFSGDIHVDYANRTVLSTDNSVYQVLPQGAVFPSDVDDLVTLCELASESEFTSIVLSPRGGGTGTNGQSLTDGVVVDLSKHLNQILEINAEQGWVRVQTGVVKDQLNAALKPHGLFFAPELSTSNRATIGGMINTDASGQGSCLYGKTRDHVQELQTVLLDGSIICSKSLNDEEFTCAAEQQNRAGLIHRLVDNIHNEHKDDIERVFPKLNRCLTGYDLAHIRDEKEQFNLNNILCGSEGTLGFIAEAKLNVLPIPKATALVIVKYANFEASLRDASHLMETGPTSIETIDSNVLNLAMNDFSWHQVEAFFSDATAVPVAGINLVEYSAESDDVLRENMAALLSQLSTTSVASTGEASTQANSSGAKGTDKASARIGYAVAEGRESVNKIWAMRKNAVGLLGASKGEARPVPFVEDTAVPPEHLADFIMEFRAILDSHNLRYGMFGHVDAGVLHVRPALDMKDPEQEKLAWQISDQVAELTQKYHGLLWGEHGKGVRSEYAPAFFGELYPQLQRIKAVFDPNNQLNPGKIATPSHDSELLKISEVTTRGSVDRQIPVKMWTQFSDAVYCNGNGACHNWNLDDAMCPSWKATRLRTHTPKGRASLIREWLRLLAHNNFDSDAALNHNGGVTSLLTVPSKIINSFRKSKGEYDFSHEVYDSMAACLSCKSCTGQCPIKVDVPEFRSKFLALYHTRYMRPLKDYLVASLETLLPIAAHVPRIYNGLVNFPLSKWVLRKYLGFVDGPNLSTETFKQHGISIANIKQLAQLNQAERDATVVIVQDAFTSYFETPVVVDIAKTIEALGFSVYLAPFNANGKPLHVHGFLNAFTHTAKKNAKCLKQFNQLGISLIGIDPSMTLTYRGEYSKYLSESELPHVALIQEWLSQHTDKLKALPNTPAQTFTLLPHCTEKTNAAASTGQWQSIFAALGHTVAAQAVGCCGMAGTYGHEARNVDTSKTIYAQSWQPAIGTHQDTSVLMATGYSCRCQVQREDGICISHPLQIIRSLLS